jgi:twinkle protein
MIHDDSDSEFVMHLPCPNCGSSDANSLYTDGHSYCFSCGHYTHGDADSLPPQRTSMASALPDQIPGEILAIPTRKISQATCTKFGVRTDVHQRRLVFPYYIAQRDLGALKYRTVEKDFSTSGDIKSCQLFGQHLWGTSGKTVVVTEGEIDCLSVFEARPTWPVVSIPNGTEGAYKALGKALGWLSGFDQIILFFDNDEPGQAAARKCATLFDPKKIYITSTQGYKDANEALVARDADAIRQAIWQAKQFSPRAVVDGSSLFDVACRPLKGKDANWPFDQLNKVTGGLRKRELVTITAGTGVGKSTFCGEVAQSLVQQGHAVGYIALEESLQRTALRLMSVVANRPLHINNDVPREEMQSFFDKSLGTGKVFLRDGFGSIDPEEILSDCRYMVKAKEVSWLILDHLSILMSGNDSGDERKLIDVTMTKLRSFVEETGVGLLLISHLKRPQGDKGHEDGGQVHLGQLRGSHAIVQLSDMVLALERNLSGGEDETNLRVLKNRFTGATGPAGTLCYSMETGRQKEIDAPVFDTHTSEEDPF